MADQYGYSSYASRLAAAATTDPYQYDPTYAGASSRYQYDSTYGLGGVESLSGSSLVESLGAAAIKRRLEALYQQNVLGTHNTIAQGDALLSANSLVKRPRFDTSHLPIYPQRPGEKDCTHYMLTRTCKFGDNCIFDHPLWVPEGGIPDWKEVPIAAPVEVLPERPGEPDCPYFLKTTKCKFGLRCKFNHPKSLLNEATDIAALPERPSEPICSFYSKTGKCKFGMNCKFHHPKDIQIPDAALEASKTKEAEAAINVDVAVGVDQKAAKIFVPPASLHNSKGLPVRPGEQDCPFYLKTGSCKYGAACRYNHPDRVPQFPLVASDISNAILQNPAVLSAAASLLPNIDPRLAQVAAPAIYPQRPGELECDYYMKTGHCKFGERCKFHHPIDRSAPTSAVNQPPVKLTLAGLPRREGTIACPFYLKTAICKYGATCRYDHPPPGEIMSTNQVSDHGDATEHV